MLKTRADEVALIFLDILMPVMDGWAFLAERRGNPSLKRIPTVILSAVHPTHPLRGEATDFMPKPFSVEDLMRVLTKYCPQVSE
jgi:CheY-like chemotaxis protein